MYQYASDIRKTRFVIMDPSKYRRVDELSHEELNELRQAMFCAISDVDGEEGNCPYHNADEIPDEEVVKNYSNEFFNVDDFTCNQYK